MGKTKEHTGFSERFLKEEKAVDAALKKVSEKLIEETKKENSYLIVSDENGIIKKIPAKDL
jgi:hypothetical protein